MATKLVASLRVRAIVDLRELTSLLLEYVLTSSDFHPSQSL
jgi:hypothetical protein